MFLAVTGTEMLIQFLLVQFGGLVFKCNKEGLTLSQWEWCLGLAAITFLVNFCMKFIRLEALCEFDWGKIFCCPGKNNEDEQFELLEKKKKKNIELVDY